MISRDVTSLASTFLYFLLFSPRFVLYTDKNKIQNAWWVLDPKNAELRSKLREAFANWYDGANNETDENCIILVICITRAAVIKDHGAVRYNIDFVNKVETEEGKIK